MKTMWFTLPRSPSARAATGERASRDSSNGARTARRVMYDLRRAASVAAIPTSNQMKCRRTRRRSPRLVQRDGGPDERLQGLLVDPVALPEVDRAPHVAVEAGIEEARRVLQRRAPGEGHLHDALVR